MLLKSLFSVPLLLAGATAMGGSITFSDSIGPEKTDFNKPLSIGKFDSSLGALTSVRIIYTGGGNSTITVTNNGGEAGGFRGAVVIDFNLSAADAAVNAVIDGRMNYMETTNSTGDQVIAAGETRSFDLTKGDGGNIMTFTDGLAAFVGSKDEVLIFNSEVLARASSAVAGDDLAVSENTFATVKLFVTYNYGDAPAIPEPSSVVMLGLAGLIGGAALRFRKSRV